MSIVQSIGMISERWLSRDNTLWLTFVTVSAQPSFCHALLRISLRTCRLLLETMWEILAILAFTGPSLTGIATYGEPDGGVQLEKTTHPRVQQICGVLQYLFSWKKKYEKPPLEKRKSNTREHTMYSPTPAGSQPLVDTSVARISLRRHEGVQSAKSQTLDLVDLCANKGMEALLYRTHNADKWILWAGGAITWKGILTSEFRTIWVALSYPP